jgi:hypothetical protein
MTVKTERRRLGDVVEARAAEGGSGRTIVGYAAVFNSTTDIGFFRERIAPGAFSAAIARDDVRALVNHSNSRVLGRNKSGTLRLFEDERGLRYEIDAPDTQDARDLLVLMDRGDINQSSFAFVATSETWDETGDKPLRTVNEVRLYDVSVVTYPAYDDTEAAAEPARRSLQLWRESQAPQPTDPNAASRRAMKARRLSSLSTRL